MTEPEKESSYVREGLRFGVSVLKIGMGLAIAMCIVIAMFISYSAYQDRQMLSREKKHEAVVEWPVVGVVDPTLQFKIKTRRLDYKLKAIIEAEGFPDFIAHPENDRAEITFTFVDEAGFGVVRLDVPIRSLMRVVSNGKAVGMLGEAEQFVSIEQFERIRGVKFSYRINTRVAPGRKPAATGSAPPGAR